MALEDFKRRQHGLGTKKTGEALGRGHREDRYFAGEEGGVKGIDAREAHQTMQQIWNNEALQEQYQKVGFHMHGAAFNKAFVKMQDIAKRKEGVHLTDDERSMGDQVQGVVLRRLGRAMACQKLIVPDLFKGLQDTGHPLNQVANKLGTARAVELVKPRLFQLIGKDSGTEDLDELHRALQEIHGVYNSRAYNKIVGRLERRRKEYMMEHHEVAHHTQSGEWGKTTASLYNDLQSDLGWFRRMKAGPGNLVRALKFGFAGMREQGGGPWNPMDRLRDERTNALNVINKVLGEDFKRAVDMEAYSQKAPEKAREDADKYLEEKDEAERDFAKGMSEKEIIKVRDAAWKTYIGGDAAKNSEREFDKWNGTWSRDFQATERQRVRDHGGAGWLIQMILSLFSIRFNNLEKPKFA